MHWSLRDIMPVWIRDKEHACVSKCVRECLCACACVCVCVRERETEEDGQMWVWGLKCHCDTSREIGDREKKREIERHRVKALESFRMSVNVCEEVHFQHLPPFSANTFIVKDCFCATVFFTFPSILFVWVWSKWKSFHGRQETAKKSEWCNLAET